MKRTFQINTVCTRSATVLTARALVYMATKMVVRFWHRVVLKAALVSNRFQSTKANP